MVNIPDHNICLRYFQSIVYRIDNKIVLARTMRNRRQAITWTNNNPVYWYIGICASPVIDGLLKNGHRAFNLSPHVQPHRHFVGDILICIFMNEKLRIPIRISPKDPIDNKSVLVQWIGTEQATSHYLTSIDRVYWRIYATLGGDGLTKRCVKWRRLVYWQLT